jgi:hypothetical protein
MRLHPALVLEIKAKHLFRPEQDDFATNKPQLRRPLTTAFAGPEDPPNRLVICDVSSKLKIGQAMHKPAVLTMTKAENQEELMDCALGAFVEEGTGRKPKLDKFTPNVCESQDRRTLAIRGSSHVTFFQADNFVSDAWFPF